VAGTNTAENYGFDYFSSFRLFTGFKVSIGATGDVTLGGIGSNITGGGAGFGIPFSSYTVRKVRVRNSRDVNNATKDNSAAVISLWTGAAGTGTQLINAQTLSNLTANTAFQEVTLASAANNTVLTATTLFLNVGTNVTGGFIDIDIYGDLIAGNL
jgi:hypothetical protein